MKAPRVRGERLIAAAVALAAALGIFIAVFVWNRPGMDVVAPSVNPFFLLQPQSVTEEAIPDYAGVRRVYAFDLSKAPPDGGRGRTLAVYLRHTIAVLEMEGKTPASTGERADQWHIGRTPGNDWLTLPIYANYNEKTLYITLTPVYGSVRDAQPVFFLIDREPLINLLLLPREGPLLALGGVAAAAGVFLALTALISGLAARDRKRVFYLGALAVAAGLWKLGGLSVVPLLLDYYGQQKAIWFTGAVAYLLLPVFSLRLLTLLPSAERSRRSSRVCCCLAAISALLLLALQIAGALEVHDLLVCYGGGAALLHFLALLGQKPDRSELFWLLPTGMALCADLVIYLYLGSVAAAPVFLVWIILNLFVRGFGFLRGAIRRERELRAKEAELQGARMQTLINQIQPHFIYNTLAAIHMICAENPKRAMEAISDFSDYLHANFDALAATEPILFTRELEHTRAYLAVEKARYAEKLNVDYHTPHTAFRLPPLTLQPIVENCVKHGLRQTHRPMHISITTRAAEGGAEIVVEDDGTGYDPAPDGAVHVGLQNVRERLSIMCGGTLRIVPRPGGGTAVTVFVPTEQRA